MESLLTRSTPGDRSHPSGRLVLGASAALILVTVAANYAAIVSQPQISHVFGIGPADASWVVFGYTATFAMATALSGGIAARTGIMVALLAGVALLALGCVAAAVAPTIETVVIARLIQGFGAGLMPTLTASLVALWFDEASRARAMGVIVAAVGAGQAFGPIVGGAMLDLLGWRATISIGIVTVAIVPILWRLRREESRVSRPDGQFDGRGAGLVALIAACLAFDLNRIPILGIAPITIAPLVLFILAAAALARHATKRPYGFVPKRIIRHKTFQHVTLVGAVAMSAYLGSVVMVPIVGSRAYGLDGFALGLLLLPVALATIASSLAASGAGARFGWVTTVRFGLGAIGLGAIALAVAAETIGLPGLIGALGLIGIGFGVVNTPLFIELSRTFHGADQPVAVGLYNLCYFLGGAAGAAVASSLIQLGTDAQHSVSPLQPGLLIAAIVVALPALSLAVFGHRRLVPSIEAVIPSSPAQERP